MDGLTKEVIASRFNIAENAPSLQSFFHQLKRQGLDPTSATIDGNPAIKQALLNVCGHQSLFNVVWYIYNVKGLVGVVCFQNVQMLNIYANYSFK